MRLFAGICLLLTSAVADAYVGPGLGIGIIGAILGLLTAVFLAVLGTVWYPMKRMLAARSAPPQNEGDGPAATARPAERDADQTRNP